MEPIKRNAVLLIGGTTLNDAPFIERGLKLKAVAAADAESEFETARAIIFALYANDIPAMKKYFDGLATKAEDHGLAQVILVNDATLAQVDAIRQKDYKHYKSLIAQQNEASKAAEFIARHKIGQPAKQRDHTKLGAPWKVVEIEPAEIGGRFSEEERLLLERAFFDCKKIYLHPLTGGVAALGVFRVDAWREEHVVGPCPMPYFVKIATLEDIDKERWNYKTYVDHYIPFHLRPNLDVRRCVNGHSKAILVGNFVDDAIPLRNVLKTGAAAGILFSLFETTLRGFRLQPFVAGYPPIGGLDTFARNRISIERLESIPEVIAEAQRLGLRLAPAEIEGMLLSAASGVTCYQSPYHGDLHQGNVMVRANDAILIDFLSSKNGAPLPADPATLEVSLMFDTDEDEKLADFPTWQALVDEIYPASFRTLHPPALFETRPGLYSWLRKALRELRHVLIACEQDETTAKIIVAAYLMRFARLAKTDISNENKTLKFRRHAYALVIAERIAQSLQPPAAAGP